MSASLPWEQSRPAPRPRPSLAVNAGKPYDVISFGFSDNRRTPDGDVGFPELSALVMIRAEDEIWMRAAEQSHGEMICVLDPAEPSSQIGAFTYMARIVGFRELNHGQLAAEFSSVGPVTPHFMRK